MARHGSRPRRARLRSLVLLLALAEPLAAAVIPVDGFDSTTAEDGVCTLREALLAANGDVALGGCPAGSGADTIVLTGDVTLTQEDSFQTGTPRIISKVTVRGNGYTIGRDAAAAEFRVLWVGPAGDLTLRETEISNGGGAAFDADGGGIYNQGRLALMDSIVANSSVHPTTPGFSCPRGGGIYSESGSLVLTDSVLVLNEACEGGGVSSFGNAVVTNSSFALNTKSAIANGGEMIVRNSALWANGADFGGGIENLSGSLSVINSTISGNTASTAGGGIYKAYGTASLVHSTLSGNSSGAGAGLFNTAHGEMTVTGSLLADHAGGSCSGSQIIDGGHNLADDTTCGAIPGTFDLSKFDTSLGDHGGPTQTHRLLTGSNAIGAAGGCGLLTDQRGALRDAACDVGAYEYGADDQYESAGSGGSDDVCFGHHTLFGRAERHLHTTDESDWVWFQPIAGSTYEIETSRLIGGSDTVLELWRACASPKLDEDDDGGVGLASKLTYTATEPDVGPGLDVLVRDFHGSGVDRGYDVAITCVSGGCTGCSAAGGNVFELSNETIVDHREIEACDAIVTSDVVVENGGAATLRAGRSVELWNGSEVRSGGSLVVDVDTALLPADITATDTMTIGGKSAGWGGSVELDENDAFVVASECAFHLTYEMVNAGSMNTSPLFSNRIRASGSVVSHQSDLELAAGEATTVLTDAYIGAGSHTLELSLDDDGDVVELDESNNKFTLTVIVGGACG